MGWIIGRWLYRQPLHVQCMVFAVFAAVGILFIRGGLATGSGREVYFGVAIAVSWPIDMFVRRLFRG